jgi:hypothetical protein
MEKWTKKTPTDRAYIAKYREQFRQFVDSKMTKALIDVPVDSTCGYLLEWTEAFIKRLAKEHGIAITNIRREFTLCLFVTFTFTTGQTLSLCF